MLGITPGSRQPVDLGSFLHPIADELTALAAGVRGVSVVGCTEPKVVHAFVIHFTTDMPAGDKLINAIGGNGENPGRFRLFYGVWHMTRYYFPPYAPDDQPPSKHRCFDVMGRSTPQRTASSIAVGVKKVEDVRAAGKSKSAVRMVARHEGFTGYSLFFCPSPDDRKRDLAIRCMWEIGPDLAPYGTMHLFLRNVLPVLWGLCCGDKDKLGGDQPWVIASAACEAIGREIKAGRPTVPLSQARALWNIKKNSSSFKAVDWMYSLLSIGDVVLADRTPEEFFHNVHATLSSWPTTLQAKCHDNRRAERHGQASQTLLLGILYACVRRQGGKTTCMPANSCRPPGCCRKSAFLWPSVVILEVSGGAPDWHSVPPDSFTTLPVRCADECDHVQVHS